MVAVTAVVLGFVDGTDDSSAGVVVVVIAGAAAATAAAGIDCGADAPTSRESFFAELGAAGGGAIFALLVAVNEVVEGNAAAAAVDTTAEAVAAVPEGARTRRAPLAATVVPNRPAGAPGFLAEDDAVGFAYADVAAVEVEGRTLFLFSSTFVCREGDAGAMADAAAAAATAAGTVEIDIVVTSPTTASGSAAFAASAR